MKARRDGPILYWSKRGDTACDAHAPKADPKRWTLEGWRRADDSRRPLQCARCHNGASVKRLPRRK